MFLSYGRDIGYSVTQFVYRGAVYSIFFPFFCFVDLGSCDFLIYCSKGLYGTFWYRTSCALSVYREEANSPSLSTLYECIFYIGFLPLLRHRSLLFSGILGNTSACFLEEPIPTLNCCEETFVVSQKEEEKSLFCYELESRSIAAVLIIMQI